jgi:hypothetical protein
VFKGTVKLNFNGKNMSKMLLFKIIIAKEQSYLDNDSAPVHLK